MPIYFLHLTESDRLTPGLEGIGRLDLQAVQQAATEGAGDLIADAVKSGDCNYQGRIDVEDGQGQRVLTVTFACPIQIDVAPSPKAKLRAV